MKGRGEQTTAMWCGGSSQEPKKDGALSTTLRATWGHFLQNRARLPGLMDQLQVAVGSPMSVSHKGTDR